MPTGFRNYQTEQAPSATQNQYRPTQNYKTNERPQFATSVNTPMRYMNAVPTTNSQNASQSPTEYSAIQNNATSQRVSNTAGTKG